MSKRNKGLFSLPPYMLYVSRALLTLEGIGLNIDPNYSVLQECFPYIARRLMTDNSPRAKNALRSMLVGSGSVLSPEKLKEVADGFSSYTAFTSSTDAVGDGQKEAQLALAKLLLSPEGNVVQDILVEGTAKAADAVARDQMQRIVMSRPGRIIKSLAKSQNDFSAMLPAPLRPLAAPLTLPYFVLNAAEDVLMPQKEDREVLDKLGSMQQVVGSMLASNSSPQPTATSADSLHNPESTQNPVSEMLGALQKQVNDPNSAVRLVAGNADIRSQVPRVAASVSRRLLSSLFNRASERIEIASKPEVDDIDTSASSSSMDDRLKKVVLQSVLDASARTARSIAKRID